MHKISWLVLMPAWLLVIGCHDDGATGEYLASDQMSVVRLSLVDTKGTVSGNIEALTILPGGDLKDQTAGLNGTRNKNLISATVEPAWIGKSVSMRIDGDHLIFDNATPVTLTRSSPEQISKAFSQARAKSTQMVADRQRAAATAVNQAQQMAATQAAAQATAQTVTQDFVVVADAQKVDDALSKAPGVAESLRSAWQAQIAKMHQLLDAERSHPGDGQAAVWRSQRVVEIDQLQIELQQSVNKAQGELAILDARTKTEGNQLEVAYNACQAGAAPVTQKVCNQVVNEWRRRQPILQQAKTAIGVLASAAVADQSESASVVSAAQGAT